MALRFPVPLSSMCSPTFLGLRNTSQQIVRLLTIGLTNREIAQRLAISHDTVGSHLSRIYARTGAASRFDLAVMAIIAGLVQFEQVARITTARAEVNRLANSIEW